MDNKLIYKTNCNAVQWENVIAILKEVEMGFSTPEIHKISFENSFSKLFVYHESNLIAFGRIISDGVRQSAIYDLAIKKEYQGMRLGSKILNYLMSTTPDCSFILYASPGKKDFYRKKGFKKMKTGMIKFDNIERMNDIRFVEP